MALKQKIKNKKRAIEDSEREKKIDTKFLYLIIVTSFMYVVGVCILRKKHIIHLFREDRKISQIRVKICSIHFYLIFFFFLLSRQQQQFLIFIFIGSIS